MPKTLRLIILWSGFYLAVLAAPLGVAAWRHAPGGRGFWIEFGVGLGFVGLAMMAMQFYLTARFRQLTPRLGVDSILQFHRQAGIISLVYILAHPVVLILANPVYLEYLMVRINPLRTIFLIIAILSLLLLVGLSVWRKQVGLGYEWWRVSHALLAGVVILISLAHVLQVGHYVAPAWKRGVFVGIAGLAIYGVIHVRLVKPLLKIRRPWRIVELRNEPGAVWTLVLEPVGHPGMRFRAGQFAWRTLRKRPLSLQQHPFSISSSAENPQRLEFTIKELGDFTGSIGQARVGSPAFLEGPYGAFTLDADFSGPLVFIVGGIGITPVMSILRTLRDRGSRRPLLLINGNKTIDRIVFREELEAMAQTMDLRIVHVLERPPEGWTGETGRTTRETLQRYLPANAAACHYYICGPDPMMDLAETELIARRVPLWNTYVERFDMV